MSNNPINDITDALRHSWSQYVVGILTGSTIGFIKTEHGRQPLGRGAMGVQVADTWMNGVGWAVDSCKHQDANRANHEGVRFGLDIAEVAVNNIARLTVRGASRNAYQVGFGSMAVLGALSPIINQYAANAILGPERH